MNIVMRNIYWRLRAWLWDMKWLAVMKIRGTEYAARKFGEAEIHGFQRQFSSRRATVAKALAMLFIGIAITSASTLGALIATRSFSNTGNIEAVEAVGVNVYSDSACTTAVSTITWGALDPGGAENYTVYVKNTGTVPLTLSMATGSWNPASASNYITLTWNQQNYVLLAGQVVQALLTLSVSPSVSGVTSFSFNTTISGTQ
jgi:archaellum component FlaG (FlaF/FlaG flagellin family)